MYLVNLDAVNSVLFQVISAYSHISLQKVILEMRV